MVENAHSIIFHVILHTAFESQKKKKRTGKNSYEGIQRAREEREIERDTIEIHARHTHNSIDFGKINIDSNLNTL